jgi:hypothetical protein
MECNGIREDRRRDHPTFRKAPCGLLAEAIANGALSFGLGHQEVHEMALIKRCSWYSTVSFEDREDAFSAGTLANIG